MNDASHSQPHGPDSPDSHGSYKTYITGFLLSVALTVVPFWVVMSGNEVNLVAALSIIFGLGALQILVHVFYFLHVDVKSEDGWKALSLVFTGILLVIILAGSIWVMFHLHENMMPAHEQIERVRNLP